MKLKTEGWDLKGLPQEKVRFPLLIDRTDGVHDKGDMRGFPRDGTEFHAGFVERSVALLVIASYARSDKIFPCVFPSERFRLNMIYGKRSAGASAILATVPVSTEDVFSRKKDPFVWDAFKMSQFNDAWVRVFGGDGADGSRLIGCNDFCFPEKVQNQRLLNTRDADGFKTLIENEYSA